MLYLLLLCVIGTFASEDDPCAGSCDSESLAFFMCFSQSSCDTDADPSCAFAECSDLALAQSQCQVDNNCLDSDCAECFAEDWYLGLCVMGLEDMSTIMTDCGDEFTTQSSCYTTNNCSAGDDDDENSEDDDECPACSSESTAIGTCAFANSCVSDAIDYQCAIDNCGDELAANNQCEIDNNCGDANCAECYAEQLAAFVCGTNMDPPCDPDDNVCFMTNCPTEYQAYGQCTIENECDTSGDDDDDDDDCPACSDEGMAIGMCAINAECEQDDITCLVDNCADELAANNQCEVDNDCDDDEDCPECYLDALTVVGCASDACEDGDNVCFLTTCPEEYQTYQECRYTSDCEDEVCSDECADEAATTFICAITNGADEDDDSWIAECQDELEARIDCEFANCSDEFEVGMKIYSCEDDTCSSCLLADSDGINLGVCDDDDEDNTSDIWACNDDNTLTITAYNSLGCSEGEENAAESFENVANGDCVELFGQHYKVQWYEGCGGDALPSTGGDDDNDANNNDDSSTTGLFVVFVAFIQALLW